MSPSSVHGLHISHPTGLTQQESVAWRVVDQLIPAQCHIAVALIKAGLKCRQWIPMSAVVKFLDRCSANTERVYAGALQRTWFWFPGLLVTLYTIVLQCQCWLQSLKKNQLKVIDCMIFCHYLQSCHFSVADGGILGMERERPRLWWLWQLPLSLRPSLHPHPISHPLCPLPKAPPIGITLSPVIVPLFAYYPSSK